MLENNTNIESRLISSSIASEFSQNKEKESFEVVLGKNPNIKDEKENPLKADKKDKLELSDEIKSGGAVELSEAEQKQVDELKKIDRETRAHEQAHLAAAAGLNASGPYYDYTTGPDNKQYAIGGEVHIDNSPVPGDPEATIRKMRRVIAAAMAPAEPSPQDRSVASKAQQTIAQAQTEAMQQKREEQQESLQDMAKPLDNPFENRLNVEYSNMLEDSIFASTGSMFDSLF